MDYNSLLSSILGEGGKAANSSFNLGVDTTMHNADSVLADVTRALSEGGALDPNKKRFNPFAGRVNVPNPNTGVSGPSGVMFTGGRPYKTNAAAAGIEGIGGLVSEVIKLIAIASI